MTEQDIPVTNTKSKSIWKWIKERPILAIVFCIFVVPIIGILIFFILFTVIVCVTSYFFNKKK